MNSRKRKIDLKVRRESVISSKKNRTNLNTNCIPAVIDLASDSENDSDISVEEVIIKKGSSTSEAPVPAKKNTTKINIRCDSIPVIELNDSDTSPSKIIESKAKEKRDKNTETNMTAENLNLNNKKVLKGLSNEKTNHYESIKSWLNTVEKIKRDKNVETNTTAGNLSLNNEKVLMELSNEKENKVDTSEIAVLKSIDKIERTSKSWSNINKNFQETAIISEPPLSKKSTVMLTDEELRELVGDISELDFGDMEMETADKQNSSKTSDSPKTMCNQLNSSKSNDTELKNNSATTEIDQKNFSEKMDNRSSSKTLDSPKTICDQFNFNKKNDTELKNNNATTKVDQKKCSEKIESQSSSKTPDLYKTVYNQFNYSKRNDTEIKNNNATAKIDHENCNEKSVNASTQTSISYNKSLALPITIDARNNRVFRFYWWDAYENSYKNPGTLYLFGKVLVASLKEYKSCCVVVKNIERQIYVLPRKYIIKNDSEEGKEVNTRAKVYAELKEYMRKNNIGAFRCKEVTKNYAFEKKDIPQSATYLEVKYSASYPPMGPNYSGPTIQAVLGTSMSALELFLVEKNIKGPCWLDIKIPGSQPFYVKNTFSWCKIEMTCERVEDISVVQSVSANQPKPPIVMVTLNVQTSLNPTLHQNEIANIGILLQHKLHLDKEPNNSLFDQSYCLVTHSRNTTWPMKWTDEVPKISGTKIIFCDTELDLLEKMLNILHDADPDIFITYDSEFQFEVLVSKLVALRVKNWSQIGKLKVLSPPTYKNKIYLGQLLCGRPICDIQKSALELNLKVTNYDLVSICNLVLDEKKCECKEIKSEDCSQYYVTVEKLKNLIQSTMLATTCILEVAMKLNLLLLAVQLTSIAGNTLSRTLLTGIADRNEFLLLHAFHAGNYIVPDKKKEKSEIDTDKKKLAYSGGTVMEPKTGFYDTLVLVMDFNSLYPSIIQEFNICFTTVPGAAHLDTDTVYLVKIKSNTGILPTEIRKLVESRKQLKKMMQSKTITMESKRQYNVRQMALKLMANSMYGCLGAPYCRFYSKGLAALITAKGRQIFQSAKEIIQVFNYEVIYGDTDSMMINTKNMNYDEVIKMGVDIKRAVNKSYKKVELDIERVYKYLLLLKKKQYAAVAIVEQNSGELQHCKEIKGLEIIRRDRCPLACDIGNQILDQLLNDQPIEVRLSQILDILEMTGKKLREGKVPLASLEMSKRLTKDPHKYSMNKNMPHVVVAQRMNKSNARKVKAGDSISYIICEDGNNTTSFERAYHIDEFKQSKNLKIDINFYLMRQIYPVVLKICDPIEGIDDVSIAQYLGITNVDELKETTCENDPINENHEIIAPFTFHCRNCKAENQIKTVITEFPTGLQPSLAMCSNPDCDTPPWKYIYAIQNKLQMELRKFITKYYFGEYKCNNPLCLKTLRRVSMDTSTDFAKCYYCFDGTIHRTYKEVDLYNQLNFYLNIFSINEIHYKSLKELPSIEMLKAYESVKEFILDQIENNAYCIVDLTKLFSSGNVQTNSENKKNDVIEKLLYKVESI